MKTIQIFIYALFLTLASCIRSGVQDARLKHIADIVSEQPETALDSLSAIEKSNLSESDRHYHDFLTVKGMDKAFIVHTSDSLILDVIDYAEKHKQCSYYPEALYYAGRVYHDLGDYPSSINFYQNVLDKIPENDQSVLKGYVLSQMGELLNTLRLYDQAIPYVDQAISLDYLRKDSIALVYDLELLCSIYMHAKDYVGAEEKIKIAKAIAVNMFPTDTFRLNAHLAAIKYNRQEIDSALYFIRHSSLLQDSINDWMAIAYASLIYRNANIPDSALLYARKLIESPNSPNHRIGYRVLFSPELNDLNNNDTLIHYVSEYWNEMESYLNRNGDRAALIQNSFYNYQLHQRERIKSEEKNVMLRNWLIAILFLVMALSIFILFLRYKNKSNLVELHKSISNVIQLREALERSEKNNKALLENFNNRKESPTQLSVKGIDISNNVAELRTQLREEIMKLHNSGKQSNEVSPSILKSDVYGCLLENVKRGTIIKENDKFWDELEETVIECYPEFKQRLTLLTGGRLKPSDMHIALMIKCGISSTNMAILAGRAKSTIVYRRKSLGLKVFDEEKDLNIVDDIIRLL